PGASRREWDSLEGGLGLSSSTSLVVTLPVLGSTSVRLTCFFGIFACALSALAAAFSAFRMGFSNAGSARSSSVKRRRGSLIKPFSQHEGGRHAGKLRIGRQPQRTHEAARGQAGVELGHY